MSSFNLMNGRPKITSSCPVTQSLSLEVYTEEELEAKKHSSFKIEWAYRSNIPEMEYAQVTHAEV